MRPGSTSDPGRRERWAAARRRVAMQHHPDRGGDPDAFVRAMAAVDNRFSRASGGSRARRTRSAIRRGLRSGLRRVRAALPRPLPGARRYFDL